MQGREFFKTSHYPRHWCVRFLVGPRGSALGEGNCSKPACCLPFLCAAAIFRFLLSSCLRTSGLKLFKANLCIMNSVWCTISKRAQGVRPAWVLNKSHACKALCLFQGTGALQTGGWKAEERPVELWNRGRKSTFQPPSQENFGGRAVRG